MLLLLPLSGCISSYDSTSNESTQPDTNTTSPTSGSVTELPNEPPQDRTWISPGKVLISNYYAGGTAEYPITVHNGKDTTCAFIIQYRIPDRTADGYSMPPLEIKDWIIIADTTPVLAGRETRDIAVTLAMPKDATITSKQWEFWVSVIDNSQQGMIKTEMASRWLVSMR